MKTGTRRVSAVARAWALAGAVAGALTGALTGGAALAGGVDRSGQSVVVLFEKGNYAEFSLGMVTPKVSGVGAGAAVSAVTPTPGQSSGDMAGDYFTFSGAYKHRFNDRISAAIIFDQPFGANVDYPSGSTYYARGSTAELTSNAVTGVMKYTLPSNISFIGGLRYQTLSAKAKVPFVTAAPTFAPYTANGKADSAVGYLIGAAFEKPEIALRVALTYNSKVKHELATSETSVAGALSSTTPINTPQSVNLEVQSGIAKDTLLFGSVRWVEWSKFDVTPTQYKGLTGGKSLVSYDSDTISYTLGLGRKFNDQWSGAVTLGYEAPTGGFASNLGPTDGYWSIGIGGSYTRDNMKISGGIRYVSIGDADTTLGGNVAAANFSGNSAIGAGIKLGFTF